MSERTKLYSIAMSAKRNIQNGVVISMLSGVASEHTTSDAEVLALKECKKKFPESQGYYDHEVCADIANENVLRMAGWEKVK